MKILLVQAHLGRSQRNFPIFPLGLCYIATALKQHTVKILDLNFWEFAIALQVLQQEILDYNPDVIGLSIRNVDTSGREDVFCYIKAIRPTAQLIKQTKPGVKLIVGGAAFSVYAHNIMERVPEFDFGVYLEGEESTPELLDRLDAPETVRGLFVRRNGSVMFTGHREPLDFAQLPMPRRDADLIDIQRYLSGQFRIAIQTKRGCALQCAYCVYPLVNGRTVRMRSPQAVVDEIEYLIGWGSNKFLFADNVFNVPEEHALEICKEILRRRIKVEWGAFYEISTFSEDLIATAKQAGCRYFAFSPDAATDAGLALLKKNITHRDIERSIALVRRHQVKAVYNLFFLPGLTNTLQTLAYCVKWQRALRDVGGRTRPSWIRIEPGTEIHRLALAEGRLTKDTDMMPADERELAGLFYRDQNWYVDQLAYRLGAFFDRKGNF